MNFFQKISLWGIILIAVLLVGSLTAWMMWFAGPAHPVIDEPRLQAAIVRVDSATDMPTLFAELKRKNIIRSDKIGLSLLTKMNGERDIKRGTYVFRGYENVFTVIARLRDGKYGYVPTKVTLPEGYTVRKMADTYNAKMPDILPEDFIRIAEPMEGYLFPDTYFFYPYATSSDVIDAMNANFRMQTDAITRELAQVWGTSTAATRASTTDISGASDFLYGVPRNGNDIIIMASILEKEVRTPEDKAMVADIFWRRIQEGMPLQADSTLTYVLGKTSAQLTTKDLRDNSPYNSYTNKGLPPTPISNPGLESIKAAMHPTQNKYVYFLSDDDGVTHYSKTYKEHLQMKQKYLK
jgi:UPF0755 protein